MMMFHNVAILRSAKLRDVRAIARFSRAVATLVFVNIVFLILICMRNTGVSAIALTAK